MTRRFPVVATLIVAIAVATMIALGVWQISRAHWKEALLARYEAAQNLPPVAFPIAPTSADLPLYRRASGLCLQPVKQQAIAGENAAGDPGFSFLVDCRTGAEGPGMRIDIGWSNNPNAGKGWRGGAVSGVLAPDRDFRVRLVSGQGLAGLAASRVPSAHDLPNNHRSYALQWFLFAAAALVIYVLALRRRLAETRQ
ncbi:SURF1 family protein [Sphingomonas ginkgonis]|uniref:SURF1-like protein n=1 Tax=Sphingomonas ginkgonis TaxID=2315330 RepID=A0A429V6L8_9SPHN|nr:SURF1 family protein [Sphingomonas ginkgonis]RST29574.1 SURF1 family protein [Sphingomonas ginkgonis]